MTENTTRDERRTAETTMETVDHTHPDTGRPFGEQVVFARGPTVAADGGERDGRQVDENENGNEEDAEAETEDEDDESVRMKDVDHEPPNESDANRVFERGREGRDGDR